MGRVSPDRFDYCGQPKAITVIEVNRPTVVYRFQKQKDWRAS